MRPLVFQFQKVAAGGDPIAQTDRFEFLFLNIKLVSLTLLDF